MIFALTISGIGLAALLLAAMWVGMFFGIFVLGLCHAAKDN